MAKNWSVPDPVHEIIRQIWNIFQQHVKSDKQVEMLESGP